MQRSPRTVFYLTLDVALILFCLFHLPEVHRRATFAIVAELSDDRLVGTDVFDPSAARGLRLGDEVSRRNELSMVRAEIAEFRADSADVTRAVG